MESRAKFVFPLGLLATAVIFDMIGAGVITGPMAAIFGLIDYLAIPSETRAMSIGILAYLCSYAAVGLALITGWLDGELVDRLEVGVDEGANLNAHSSLTFHGAHLRRA